MGQYPMVALLSAVAAAFILATLVAAVVARAGFPRETHANRLGCIDGLRGYLAISVLAFHFILWMQVTRLGGEWLPPPVSLLNHLGAGGVALFFMTTGALFYPRVLAGFRATSWQKLLIGRVFRIIPLIVFSVCVVCTIIVLRTQALPVVDRLLIKVLAEWITGWAEPPLFGYPDSGRLNAFVLWSIWYEWLFYLIVLPVCALAMDLIRPRLPSWTLPLALLVGSLLLTSFFKLGGLMLYLPLFAAGMLAYECQNREAVRTVLRSPAAAVAAGLCLIVAAISAPTPYGAPQVLLYGVFFACVAAGNDLGGLLRSRGSLVLGECSYGIYLLHGTVLSLLFVEGTTFVEQFSTDQLPVLIPLAAVVVACITPLTYLLIERPAIRLGKTVARAWLGLRSQADRRLIDVAGR